MAKRPLTSVLACAALFLTAAPASAIIDGLENDDLFHQPGSYWYGMSWDNVYSTRSGTSVAIGYFTILTANHYSFGVGNTFFAPNGDEFEVVSAQNVKENPDDSVAHDLRILTVKNNTESLRPLPGFYELYDGPLTSVPQLALVGTGYSGTVHAFESYRQEDSTGRAKRWGTNKYTYSNTRTEGGLTTAGFTMDFYWGGSDNESGYATGDSGGGVFIKDGDTWKLAGIHLYRDGYPGWWSDIYAASVPEYADWLNDFLKDDLLPGDTDLDGSVDVEDYLTVKRYLGTTSGAAWERGDFDADGDVDRDDYRAILVNFGYTSQGHPPMIPPPSAGWPGGASSGAVPEPAVLGLLAVAAPWLVRRRLRRRR